MRRILIVIFLLGVYLGLGVPTLALEISGYLSNQLKITDGQDVTGSNKAKLDLRQNGESYFVLVSLTGINNYFTQSIIDENNILKLNRAYLNLYPSWGKITIGLQNLAWGSSYLFNLADQFNMPNPVDPKGEKQGINALAVKWNITDTAMSEAVVLPASKFSESDFGLRGKCTFGRYDLMLNYIKKSNLPLGLMERRTGAGELRGELGDNLPGVWAQVAYISDEKINVTESYFSYVIGSDYTFNIGNGIYLLVEYQNNGAPDALDKIYYTSRFSPISYLTLMLSVLDNLREKADLYSLNTKYQFNDNVELSGTYNYYPEGSLKFGLSIIDFKSELILEIKTSF